jgi:ParB family transcriptional regulator, chromosome partitioning protein
VYTNFTTAANIFKSNLPTCLVGYKVFLRGSALPVTGRQASRRSPYHTAGILQNQFCSCIFSATITHMGKLASDSIFWVPVDKIEPNPYQPRREFDETKLNDLADSIRQYGVLQPLVVSRTEVEKSEGGIATYYELIAGERRLRAAKLAGLREIPVIIRTGDDDKMKLELSIIENIQREDLNPIDRAKAFMRLIDEFGFSHTQVSKKVGKSREYVSNSLRLLQLPEEIMKALEEGKITEGHTRPIMMLSDRPMEQDTLFKEILYKRMSVREAERIARSIAVERARKREGPEDPAIREYQDKLSESLGTRVKIERRENGGKIVIDFFTPEDLATIMSHINTSVPQEPNAMLNRFVEKVEAQKDPYIPPTQKDEIPVDDRSEDEIKQDDSDLYSIKNFTI